MELTTVLQDPGIWIAASKEVTAHAELTVDFDFLALSGAQEVTISICLSVCSRALNLHLLTQVSSKSLLNVSHFTFRLLTSAQACLQVCSTHWSLGCSSPGEKNIFLVIPNQIDFSHQLLHVAP